MPRMFSSLASLKIRSPDNERTDKGLSRSGSVSSVARMPFLGVAKVPETITNGLPEPEKTSPIAAMAARSTAAAWGKLVMSKMKARWMIPSHFAAPDLRLSVSSRVPRWGSAPRLMRVEAWASVRTRPSTEWPWERSSRVVAWPMKPAAPVTKTCMVVVTGWEEDGSAEYLERIFGLEINPWTRTGEIQD